MEENWKVDLLTEYQRGKSQNRIKKVVLMMDIRNLGRANGEIFRKKSDNSFRGVELKQMIGHLKGTDLWVHGEMRLECI